MSLLSILGSVASHCPELIVHLRFLKALHRTYNFRAPLENLPILGVYVAKAQLHNGHNERWSIRADKYAVREEIKKLIGEKYLIPLYGHWDNPEDIDFDSLPDSFILKTNNGCGTNVFVHDKSKLDRKAAIKQLKASLAFPYPQLTGQLHYSLIKPCVIAEKLMVEKVGKSLTDYKIHCVNGEPILIYVYKDRDETNHFDYRLMAFDKDWNEYPEAIGENFRTVPGSIEKPQQLDELIDLARKLSADDEYVRVDFYIIDNKIYFGELTYTPDTMLNGAFAHNGNNIGANTILGRIKADRRSGKSKYTF